MPKYSYSAVGLDNKKVRDVLEARDETDLRRILRAQSLVLTSCKPVEEKRAKYRLRAKEVGEFSRQLASMLGSGITVLRALEILKNRDFKRELLTVYERLYRDVQLGHTLSEALRMQTAAFPELFINMYASAEASGQLESVALKMASHYEKEHRLNSKVKTAMMYPAILSVVTLIVVYVIFTQILPELFRIFGEDVELPPITQAVMGVSEFLQRRGYVVIIAAFFAVITWRALLSVPKIRQLADRIKLKLPIIGKLLKIICTARFARTLSSLYSSGVTMITALEITSAIVGNSYIESQFTEVIKNIRNGEALSDSVGAVQGFDTKLAASILIGEESGRLDTLLDSTADGFDYEAEEATNRLVQLISPVMIVIMAAVVGIIMVSVMIPLMNMRQMIR